MPTFDGDNLIVTLDPVVDGVMGVDVLNDLYEPWKDWMLESTVNRRYPPTFRSDGGNPLSSIINQGAYIFLNNVAGWRLKPYESDGTWYLTGNLAVEDTALPAFIPTIGTYTAAILGLQPVTQGVSEQMGAQLEHAAFDKGVTLDEVKGVAGTGYDLVGNPIGTLKTPSNNLSDTMTIANTRGLGIIYVLGDVETDPGEDYSDMTFIGASHQKTTLTLEASSNLDGCEYYYTFLAGTLDADAVACCCMFGDLYYVNGEIKDCILKPDGVMMLGSSEQAVLLRCVTECTEGGPPYTIDFNGSGTNLAVRSLDGQLKLQNKTGPEDSSIIMSGGKVILDLTTLTNGRIKITGIAVVIDTLGNPVPSGEYGDLTIVNSAMSNVSVADAVSNFDLTGYVTHTTLAGVTAKNAYRDIIDINILSGESGTAIPIGLPHRPVNNIPDALTLLEQYHCSKFRINGNTPIPAGTNLNGINFIAGTTIDRTITIPDTATTNGTKFYNITLTGTLAGKTEMERCILEDLYGVRGSMIECAIAGTIDLDDSTGQLITMDECRTGGDGAIPDININGAKVSIIGWTGALNIHKKTGLSVMGVSTGAGTFRVKNTCTSGVIIFAGVGTQTIEDGVTSIISDSNLLNKENITKKIVTYNGEYHA